jgi:hypothetical protein
MVQPALGSRPLPHAMVTYVVLQDDKNLKGPVGVYRWIWVSRRVVFTTIVELAEGKRGDTGVICSDPVGPAYVLSSANSTLHAVVRDL